MKNFLKVIGLVTTLALGLSGGAVAQSYPSGPVTIVVPAAAGGPTDIVARIVAEGLAEAWGQPVVVDNRPGAGHMIGTEAVAKAEPDGYTLVLVSSPHVTNPSFRDSMPYDAIEDFESIVHVASSPLVLVVNPSVEATTVAELIEYAQQNPEDLTAASAGNGTGPHFAAELFQMLAGVEFLHVPYGGGPPATNAVLSGEADLYFDTPSAALPHVEEGNLRALAVTSSERSTVLPDVPTVAETGLEGYLYDSWQGLLAPAGTPSEIVEKINAEVGRILEQDGVRQRLNSMMIEPVGGSQHELADMISREIAKWNDVVAQREITAN